MMLRGRKGALLLLVVAVLWTALPAATCLLQGQSMDRLACCQTMAPDCPMQGPDMNGSCCNVQPEQIAVLADVPILAQHGHSQALLFHLSQDALPAMITAAGWHAPEASPPDISPGAKSILRI